MCTEKEEGNEELANEGREREREKLEAKLRGKRLWKIYSVCLSVFHKKVTALEAEESSLKFLSRIQGFKYPV